ncbi:prolipoprotein diacylglyceryl transferase [Clostridium peptidivorans]|uniref:prolipoprotein diacylglyceryl transferase n=1 Tax=Clostridium peptidivorans TaxID=100174 RepID=UPI000BE47758|nr:prolipoprotein diacylglyceryl transferase [Clostridium peptidivorans]
MRPVLFELFSRPIYGYGTMIAIGILAALLLLSSRVKKNSKYNEDDIYNMSLIAIASGIAGGKLLYIITEMRNIIEDPSLLKDVGSGFVIYGSIIGGAISIFFYCKRKKWDTLDTFDLIIPSIPLAQGFGRIGCLLAGCCYGRPTDLPIGIVFNNSPFAPSGVHIHPTQIYSSIFDFLLVIFLLWYDKRKNKKGNTFALYIIIYSIGRIIVEMFRGDPRGTVSILSTSQFISIFTLILGIVLFNIRKPKVSFNN